MSEIFTKVFGVVLILLPLLIYYLIKRKKTPKKVELNKSYSDKEMLVQDNPISFGYKCIWLTVKTSDKEKLFNTLGLKKMKFCNWQLGINQAYEEGRVYITPSIGEWTIAVGWGLAMFDAKDEKDEIENYKKLINKVSAVFDEAQLYVSYRVSDYYLWAISKNGELKRMYGYIGGGGINLVIEGELSEIEKKYNFVNTFSEEAKNDSYFEREDIDFPDEDIVMEIAGAWGINPGELEERTDIKKELGIIGIA